MKKRKRIIKLAILILIVFLAFSAVRNREMFEKIKSRILERRGFLSSGLPIKPLDPETVIFNPPTPASTPAFQPIGKNYNVGFASKPISFFDENGKSHTLITAFWYPTDANPQPYAYDTIKTGLSRGKISSFAVKDAAVSNGSFPVILFFHGAFMCGTQSVFLTERLASEGFIVAAPDYPDDANLCNTNGGAKSGVLEGVRSLKIFLNQNKETAIKKLAENQRIPGASRILDAVIAANNDSSSLFFNKINTSLIGGAGHSYGGRTLIGLIGPHSNPDYEDGRIKAAILLSGGVFPFEENLVKIKIPIMVIQGDADIDDFDLSGKNVARKKPYDDAIGPKYFIKLIGGSHGSFYNGACSKYESVQECQKKDPIVNAINEYSAAFFQKYLNKNAEGDSVLDSTLPAVRIYEKKLYAFK